MSKNLSTLFMDGPFGKLHKNSLEPLPLLLAFRWRIPLLVLVRLPRKPLDDALEEVNENLEDPRRELGDLTGHVVNDAMGGPSPGLALVHQRVHLVVGSAPCDQTSRLSKRCAHRAPNRCFGGAGQRIRRPRGILRRARPPVVNCRASAAGIRRRLRGVEPLRPRSLGAPAARQRQLPFSKSPPCTILNSNFPL